MSRISEKTKIKQNRGTGIGAEYIPWIYAREIGSIGTESVFTDWKHGRPIQCLSQGEARTYYLLRWRDDVIDIREQYPLNLSATRAIAYRTGLPHPHDQHTHMTTDMLVTYQNPNGTQYHKAYTIKPNQSSFNEYAYKNFLIEQAYWSLFGIHLEIIYSDNLNKIFAENIKHCVRYYNLQSVKTDVDYIKHLISKKKLILDMESQYLDFPTIVKNYNTTTINFSHAKGA